MINLNDDSFNEKQISIFNNGTAGVVNNVKLIRIERKTDAGNNPDYKLVFADSANCEVNFAFWYLDQNKDTFAKDLTKQGKTLKHLINCYAGANFQFPAFNTPQELLDTCMNILHQKAFNVPVRVYATYGTTQGPKKYIQLRSYVPFIEPMSVPVEQTRLQPNSIDQMVRLQEDAPFASTPNDLDNTGII